MEDFIMKLVSNVGIPAAVAIFVLLRIEPSLKEIGNLIDRNTLALMNLCSKLGDNNGVSKILEKDDKKNV